MEAVHTDRDPIRAGWIAARLEAEGFHVTLRNYYLGGAAGELPPTEVWPEVWVLDDREAEAARARVAAYLAEPEPDEPDWICPNCGETVDGFLDRCWNCNTPHPEEGGASP